MSIVPRTSFFDTDRLFGDFFAPASRDTDPTRALFSPRIDIVDKDDHFEITAELPGVKKERINIHLENGVLTIEAEANKDEKEEKDGVVIRQERRYGKFLRSFNLGPGIEEKDISANFKHGILTLKAPKLKEPASTQKRIAVE